MSESAFRVTVSIAYDRTIWSTHWAYVPNTFTIIAQFQATWKVRNPPVIWALRWVPSIRSCKTVLNSAFHGIKPEPRSSFCSNPPLCPGAQPCSPPHWICSGGVESWAAVFSCWKFLLVLTEHLKTHNEGIEESLKKNPIWRHTIKAQSKEKRKIRT